MAIFSKRTLGFKFKAMWFFVKSGLGMGVGNYNFEIISSKVGAIVCNFTNVESILGVGFSSKHNRQSCTHLFVKKIAKYPTCD
jgi:hypothetical protein